MLWSMPSTKPSISIAPKFLPPSNFTFLSTYRCFLWFQISHCNLAKSITNSIYLIVSHSVGSKDNGNYGHKFKTNLYCFNVTFAHGHICSLFYCRITSRLEPLSPAPSTTMLNILPQRNSWKQLSVLITQRKRSFPLISVPSICTHSICVFSF